jgi:hypothetical protein
LRRLRAPGSVRRAADTGRMDSERTASPNPLLFDASAPQKVGIFWSECLPLLFGFRALVGVVGLMPQACFECP